MANNLSIEESVKLNKDLLETNTNFLLESSKMIEQCGLSTPCLRRYYRLRLNSLLDTETLKERECTKIMEQSKDGVYCPKCGSSLVLKIKSKTNFNKSKERKYCKYLHQDLIELCPSCLEYSLKHNLKKKKRRQRKLKKPMKKPIVSIQSKKNERTDRPAPFCPRTTKTILNMIKQKDSKLSRFGLGLM